jgi:hypothetical protein
MFRAHVGVSWGGLQVPVPPMSCVEERTLYALLSSLGLEAPGGNR